MDQRAAEWARLHTSGGGSMSWRQIAQEYGTTPEAVRSAVWRLRQAGGPIPARVESPPAAAPTVLDPHHLPEDWADLLYRNAAEQARLRQAAHKQYPVYTVQIPERLPILLVWTADQHLLDAGTDHDAWDADVAIWTSTPGIYIIAGGDWANWFSPAVLPRAMPANTVPSDFTEPVIRRQIEKLHGKERRILAGVVGNHDEFPGVAGWHPIDRIYQDLGIPNLGPGGRVYLRLGDETYQIEARHSFNYNSSLNDTNSMRRIWEQAGCPDIVFTAHLHRATLHTPVIDGRDTVWARNGSYKQDDQYARSRNFVHTRPSPPDQPGVILFPDRHKMLAMRNYRDLLPLLAYHRERYSRQNQQSA